MQGDPRTIQILFFSLLLLLSGCGLAEKDSNTEAEFSIDNYKGKWLILNYWAEWCAPCIKEIPELNTLDNDYSADLDVVAVNFDHIKGQALIDLAARMRIDFDVLEQDPADILRLSRPASLPTTYLFDRSGKLHAKLVGPQTIETLLKQTDIQ
ncbi:MAG TPA: TlpA family protein disulfide reductase [Cellvibrionales bacterium]|nr:TlpA family protein disulfide reductase [Cellvibrionales bacterium]HAW14304.1 TlpA family protein disulfide reductase [Cellvibrionales bacterium]HCX26734.1 TlpA family protein disulfide reductase [Cellvibrionales bacterium]